MNNYYSLIELKKLKFKYLGKNVLISKKCSLINTQNISINVFLNEQCKDALTMEQFINKIEVSLSFTELRIGFQANFLKSNNNPINNNACQKNNPNEN